jgi:TusA-related sulfurtransferase
MKTLDFDIRGQVCPSTLLVALREMNANQQALRDGSLRLRFRSDNRNCVTTIPGSARSMGYAVDVRREEGCYVIEVSGG